MVRLAAAGIVLASCAALAAQPAGVPPGSRPVSTLADALAAFGIDTSGLAKEALATRVSDFAVDTSDAHALVAYYEAGGASRVIQILVREGSAGAWHHAAVDGAVHHAGVVTQIRQAGTLTLIDTRVDDATDVLLVLDRTLAITRVVAGHLLAVLPDNTVLLRENTGEYAPTQPALVSVFVPWTGARARLHPVPPWSLPRQRFVDRVKRAYSSWGLKACIEAQHHCNAERFDGAVVSEVRADPRGDRVAWVERLGPPAGSPRGPVDFHTHVLVTCDRPALGTGGRCRERAFGGYDGPDGKATLEALDSVVTAPTRD